MPVPATILYSLLHDWIAVDLENVCLAFVSRTVPDVGFGALPQSVKNILENENKLK